MRLSAVVLRALAFAIAAVAAIGASNIAVSVLEQRSSLVVREKLIDERFDWAKVIADGLQIILEGEAPSEAARFRAISLAGGVVDASRVIDNLRVAESDGFEAPTFAIEILRNDSGVSLIGLIPSEVDRDDLADRITSIADGQPVTDLLEIADYPAPESWRPATSFALRALGQLPRSKVSVRDGSVEITAISDSSEQKRELEASLLRSVPDTVTLSLQISAPRPVISPYITRFSLDEAGARFDSCTAGDEESRAQIIAAAVEAGIAGSPNCLLALGAPSKTWPDAVAMSIEAISDLGGGLVTISDTDIHIVARENSDQTRFERVIGDLENALPDIFALDATLPVTVEESEEGPPEFSITLSPEGYAQLRGKIADELMNVTAENYAKARFGRENVHMGTLIAEGLPNGWSVRVLAGIEALSFLTNGSVTVAPDHITVSGNTGNPDASGVISRMLIEKLGETTQFELKVNYVEALDPIAALPTPEECVGRIMQATGDRKILFDPGSDILTAATQPVIDDIADALEDCFDAPIEIAGYTDSQGREEMNLALSKNRAEAVLTALRARRVPTGSFVANGYGEENPIADNETEEGREANRRIEFRLFDETAVEAEAAEAGEENESEVSEDVQEEPATEEPSSSDEAAATDEAATESQ